MADFPETYSLAHTARCKLQLAADRPDRNLRFILGHAFTLDKLRLRLAEIETSSGSDDDFFDDGAADAPVCTGGHDHTPQKPKVSFTNSTPRQSASPQRARSPPPDQFANLSDTDSDSDSESDEYDEEGLSLQRFGSAAAAPPKMIDDDGSDDDDVAEPTSPTEEELRLITGGDDNPELHSAYEKVSQCPCHGEKGPRVEKVWEVPQKTGAGQGPRVAVVQVA